MMILLVDGVIGWLIDSADGWHWVLVKHRAGSCHPLVPAACPRGPLTGLIASCSPHGSNSVSEVLSWAVTMFPWRNDRAGSLHTTQRAWGCVFIAPHLGRTNVGPWEGMYWVPIINPTWSWCLIHLTCCWIPFARISLRILASVFVYREYWSVVFLWCFVWLWCRGNAGLKCSLLFKFWEKFEKDWYSLNIWKNSPVKPSGPWLFCLGRFLIT